ncbi:NAD(P)/FAD-dependent oxidoreductase [Patulibacter sp. SYSU D01012]|uniref:NAD(P)/FAD-dependent oxidoreductase n=1 Tax=Patulibacter sp. SYSU D01012 TaxID=2817381 RepID=UPI001B305F9A|nr:NAD(P)/FAD-dependent oxidoreductase [Patulibacter sp. SYSU D01012]
MTTIPHRDVVIVGGGVVGLAIAQQLTRHRGVGVTLLEARADVGAGTSKANTAILHTGFDATPGTIESRLVARGHELLHAYGARVGIPIEPLGALLVAWDEEQHARFPDIVAQARANGYDRVREIPLEELRRREPHLGPGAIAALEVPDEHIVCPFTTPLAYAYDAVQAGLELRRSTRVTAVDRLGADDGHPGGGFRVHTTAGVLTCRFLVNAAGLGSDVLHRLAGHEGYTVTPRRGELLVFDKLSRPLVNHVLLPVPTATTKGVLVSPTVFGNLLLGPTADDVPDKEDRGSTPDGIARLLDAGARIVPALLEQEITATYVGLRAATEHKDYQLELFAPEGYVSVGGIRSTGLTASLAIGEEVCRMLGDEGLQLDPRDDLPEVHMPNVGQAFPRPFEQEERIAADPAYGEIVCFCERTTRGEIRDALCAPVPAVDQDGVRRRTRATMGRCQTFYCGARVQAMLDEANGGPAAPATPTAPRKAVA